MDLRTIANVLSVFLIVALHTASAMEADETGRKDSLLTAQIRAKVNRILENFQRNMDAYYERTRAKKKAPAITPAPKEKEPRGKDPSVGETSLLISPQGNAHPLGKASKFVPPPIETYDVPVYWGGNYAGELNDYNGTFTTYDARIPYQEGNGSTIYDKDKQILELKQIQESNGRLSYIITNPPPGRQPPSQQQPRSYLQLMPTFNFSVPGYREEFERQRQALWQEEQEQKKTAHERSFDIPYHVEPYKPYLYADEGENMPQNNVIPRDVTAWLEGKWGDSKTITLSELPDDSYIAWFGTAHKGFDQRNGDNNGYAWLSNYHEAKKINPNSSFQPNYVIQVKVNGKVYEAGNVETFYHMYKFYTQVTPANQQPKAINYSDFPKKDPNSARSAARDIKQFAFGKADQLMLHLLEQKFFNNNRMAKALLDTGDKLLLEGNRWDDAGFGMKFSGTATSGRPPAGSTLEGQNKLGKMLMTIRKKISDKKASNHKFASFINDRAEQNVKWVAPLDFSSF